MALNPGWKGFLRFSLVSFPVRAYTAVGEGEKIHFNQLHAECHSRINYKKTCPIHGEVNQDEIVSGFEYSKGQYVVVDPDELDKLRTEDEKAITISTSFVRPDTIDPVYFSGKTYYLVPDGPVGQKPYAVFLQAMIEDNRHAIAQVVIHGREQLVLLRPMDKLLAMSVLNYENRVTKPQTFEDQAPSAEPSGEELELTRTLVKAKNAKKLDFSTYRDVYTEKLTKVVEAKVAGQEVVAPPVQEQPHIINLMDALRASVASAQKEEHAEAKPQKKVAGSKGKETRARKRKSS
jgi:DNA end-binding protein Ku